MESSWGIRGRDRYPRTMGKGQKTPRERAQRVKGDPQFPFLGNFGKVQVNQMGP